MTPPEALKAAGEALYGNRWVMRLSRDLGVSDDTMTRWLNGKTEVPPSHEALKTAEKFLRAKAVELLAIADKFGELRETQAPKKRK
jgi:transcriptional regulator with XRE-family HTH domain